MTPVRASARRSAGWLDTAIASIGVWLLYVPHYTALRLLTPRYGLAWARFVARVHWLVTFVGVHRDARRNLAALHPRFRGGASVSTILRRHLEMKHECFARVRVYHQHGARAGEASGQDAFSIDVAEECATALEAARRSEQGLVIVGFHVNHFEMVSALLQENLPERSPLQVKLRRAHNIDHATSYVASLATDHAAEADRLARAPVFYLDESGSVLPLVRVLRKGGTLALAADGAYAKDFIDAPFFDGTLRVSTGWARLAAMTKSRVLVMLDTAAPDRRGGRRLMAFDHVQPDGTSEDAVRATVEGAIKVLEEAIAREPWGWHPWQRLGDRGGKRYELTQSRIAETQQRRSQVAERFSKQPADAKPRRPRIAILCNSVTPYRLHLHRRIVDEMPEVELWTLTTHGNAYSRWAATVPPDEIRPVEFGHGEPTNEQTLVRYSAREWRKGGRVIDWLREHRPDAVFCQGCGDVGRLRVLRWCHANETPAFLTGDFNTRGTPIAAWKHPLKRVVYRSAIDWSTGLMPCGQLGLDLLHRYGGHDKPTYWFPFVPDTSLQAAPPADTVRRVRQRFAFDRSRRRLVFSARMMPVKRPDIAIKAFAAIAERRPDWDLVMLGDGVLREPSEALVPPALRDRVLWTGFFDDPADVAAVYATCDAMLLPSDHEPWGVVVVEAAAAGLAIVASDVVGAAPELVRPGRNGETFPAGDVSGLAEALLRVTDEERIDRYRDESPRVLHEWLDQADPVDGLRAALRDCGVLPPPPAPVDPIATIPEARVPALT